MTEPTPPKEEQKPEEKKHPMTGQITKEGILKIEANLEALSYNMADHWQFEGFMLNILRESLARIQMRVMKREQAKTKIIKPNLGVVGGKGH